MQQLALSFLATFLVVTLLNNDLLSRHCPGTKVHLYGLSSLALPLRQRTCIKPFTANKALS